MTKKPHFLLVIHPSSIGRCTREIVYALLGYKGEPIDPRSYLIMENGTYFHSRVENIVGNSDIIITPEYCIKSDELNISGRSDILIENIYPHISSNHVIKLYSTIEACEAEPKLLYEGPDNDIMIVELKSINSKGYAHVVNNNKPKIENLMQLQLYMHLTGIREGLLLYENKDSQYIKEFRVLYSEEIVQQVLDQISRINNALVSKELPPKEHDKSDRECENCRFKFICWPNMQVYSLDSLI
jgi:CRISPR/Cas system-associated exonuclease Cas4 (RecB family)